MSTHIDDEYAPEAELKILIHKKINLVDYQGNSEILDNKYGCVLLPATYTLDKSIEYADLLNTSSDRAIYKEGEENEKIL